MINPAIPLSLAGIAIDSADALAGYLSGTSGAVPRSKGGMLAGAAAGAALLGALGLRAKFSAIT